MSIAREVQGKVKIITPASDALVRHDTRHEGHDTCHEGHDTRHEGHDTRHEGHDTRHEGHA